MSTSATPIHFAGWGADVPSDVLPNSEIHALAAGHYAWEQASGEYGRLVADWIGGGYRRVAAG